jgi:hypothetical protein
LSRRARQTAESTGASSTIDPAFRLQPAKAISGVRNVTVLDWCSVRSALLVSIMLAPSTADAISLIPTGTVAGPFRVELKGSLFVQGRSIHLEGADANTELELTRARIGLDLHWKEYIHLQIEPDFAEGEVDPADLYMELSPVRELDVLLGRAKVPFGALELESRWDLPSIRRGLVSDVVSDRHGIGGRSVGAKASLRLKQVPLRPGLDVGAYRDSVSSEDTDGAIRIEMRPGFKGSELSLAGYARGGISAGGGYGYAGAVAFKYDRKGVYFLLEGMIVRAALLRQDGARDEDATLYAGRLLVAYAIGWDDLAFEPYLGLEVLDPNARTRADLGGAIRGGLNLLFSEVLRFGLEVDHQRGQRAFAEPDRTTVTLFVGVFLE